MIKNIIAPIQTWLLSRNRCVGCSAALSKGIKKEIRGKITITCHCGRIFIYNPTKNIYRRALFDEV